MAGTACVASSLWWSKYKMGVTIKIDATVAGEHYYGYFPLPHPLSTSIPLPLSCIYFPRRGVSTNVRYLFSFGVLSLLPIHASFSCLPRLPSDPFHPFVVQSRGKFARIMFFIHINIRFTVSSLGYRSFPLRYPSSSTTDGGGNFHRGDDRAYIVVERSITFAPSCIFVPFLPSTIPHAISSAGPSPFSPPPGTRNPLLLSNGKSHPFLLLLLPFVASFLHSDIIFFRPFLSPLKFFPPSPNAQMLFPPHVNNNHYHPHLYTSQCLYSLLSLPYPTLSAIHSFLFPTPSPITLLPTTLTHSILALSKRVVYISRLHRPPPSFLFIIHVHSFFPPLRKQ